MALECTSTGGTISGDKWVREWEALERGLKTGQDMEKAERVA